MGINIYCFLYDKDTNLSKIQILMTRKQLYILLIAFCNTLGSCGCNHAHNHNKVAKRSYRTEKQEVFTSTNNNKGNF